MSQSEHKPAGRQTRCGTREPSFGQGHIRVVDHVAGGSFNTAGSNISAYFARSSFSSCPCSIADITGIGGPPALPEGLITGDDFNSFIDAFVSGSLLADITGPGGPPAPPDGMVTGDDFNGFIGAFVAGCP